MTTQPKCTGTGCDRFTEYEGQYRGDECLQRLRCTECGARWVAARVQPTAFLELLSAARLAAFPCYSEHRAALQRLRAALLPFDGIEV